MSAFRAIALKREDKKGWKKQSSTTRNDYNRSIATWRVENAGRRCHFLRRCATRFPAGNFRSPRCGFENAPRQLLFSLYCYYTRARLQRGVPYGATYVSAHVYVCAHVAAERHSFFSFPQGKCMLHEKFRASERARAFRFARYVVRFVARVTFVATAAPEIHSKGTYHF